MMRLFSRRSGSRILLYSHDTFGLGHLRRCRAIAHSLVERNPDVTALILTGSPIIGAFDFRARVDFVRVPGVIKLRNGDYTSLNLHLDIEDTVRIRESIIQHTADIFDPDILIVDKEPLGLRGEMEPTLHMLKKRGTRMVLGLRDVLDEPKMLAAEWDRKGALPAVEAIYDEIWVYGLKDIYDPLAGLNPSRAITEKMVYTGYLPRPLPTQTPAKHWPEITSDEYLLVMTGGGGDGEGLIDWVLTAYEQRSDLPLPALLVLGPFMAAEKQVEFQERAERLENVDAIVFHAQIEHLVDRAKAIVAMGGYNTFCELLTLDKPALVVPRTIPRQEQYLRATKAEELGLIRMLVDPHEADGGPRDPGIMAEALKALMQQPKPSDAFVPGLLGGFDRVNQLVAPWLDGPRRRRFPFFGASKPSQAAV
jgi:predicted glycosyltransferase